MYYLNRPPGRFPVFKSIIKMILREWMQKNMYAGMIDSIGQREIVELLIEDRTRRPWSKEHKAGGILLHCPGIGTCSVIVFPGYKVLESEICIPLADLPLFRSQ